MTEYHASTIIDMLGGAGNFPPHLQFFLSFLGGINDILVH